jgi:H+/Cl- antiporter ClcA
VKHSDDNAIAAAFRSLATCTVHGRAGETGAIVVPLMTSGRCLGALSIELRDGREKQADVTDASQVLASMLASFVADVPLAAVVNG